MNRFHRGTEGKQRWSLLLFFPNFQERLLIILKYGNFQVLKQHRVGYFDVFSSKEVTGS